MKDQSCIDCAACVDPCPVDAIFAEEDQPEEWAAHLEISALHLRDALAAQEWVNALLPAG